MRSSERGMFDAPTVTPSLGRADRDARMALLKVCKTRNEPKLRERVAYIERNDASFDACRLGRPGDHPQRRSDLLEEPKPLAGQFDRIVAANEKPLSDLLFELANLMADGARGDAESRGRCLQASKPRRGFERPHGVQHGQAQLFPHRKARFPQLHSQLGRRVRLPAKLLSTG